MFYRFCFTIPVLILSAGLTFAQEKQKTESNAVVQTLENYAAAVRSKDMAVVEKYVLTTDDFTMFEGGHINWGWIDYRDHHLGPELKQFLEFKYGYHEIKPHVFGDIAYATLKYNIAVKTKEREFSGQGLATVVLVQQNGSWKIRHMHTSRIPKREH